MRAQVNVHCRSLLAQHWLSIGSLLVFQDITTKSTKLDSVIGELENEMGDPDSVMQDLVISTILAPLLALFCLTANFNTLC